METRVRYETYRISGTTRRQARSAQALLAPVRHGRRYGGYTDWEVIWCFDPVARHVDVRVEATVTLPDLRMSPVASRGFAAEWSRYLAALRRHEEGHVAIATEAGKAVAAALAGVDTAEDAQRIAAEVVRRHHERERAYDQRTEHGALGGVRWISMS